MTTRGASFTRSRLLAPGGAPASSGRALLLRFTSEANFEDWVVRTAHRYGWCGHHTRHSQGAVRGVHRTIRDGHGDAYGWPDWEFFRDGGPFLYRELKTEEGVLSKDQREMLARLQRAGADVAVWRPSDEQLILRTFRT